jgi:hypothetical protein
MNEPVSGVMEGSGYTRLDLVKHAAHIQLQNLSEHDFVTVITFNTSAKILVRRCSATPQAMKTVLKQVSTLVTEGNTNLYDALDTAYTYLESDKPDVPSHHFVNTHIVVLTDGCPNIHPLGDKSTDERTYTAMMDRHFEKSDACRHSLLHVFGMTHNSLDDHLLLTLARHGQGMYGFISDAVIVSPCFINVLGILFNMAYTGLDLLIEGTTDSLNHLQEKISIPWILQEGHVNVKVPNWVFKIPTLTFKLYSNRSRLMRTTVMNVIESEAIDKFNLARKTGKRVDEIATTTYAEYYESLLSDLGQDVLKKADRVASHHGKEWLQALSKDVDMYKRINVDGLKMWAKFAMRSLAASLEGEYVTNGYEQSYKAGLSAEGRSRLAYWLSQIESVAKNILLPNPTITPSRGYKSVPKGTFIRTTSPKDKDKVREYDYEAYTSSSRGNDHDDGCVDGMCVVTMADDSLKFVKDVVLGDRVKTDTGVGVVRCSLLSPSAQYVHVPGGLRITAMHPIYYENHGMPKAWIFPKHHPQGNLIGVGGNHPIDMYSFLLEPAATPSNAMHMNGVWVVHFSHNNADPVLSHPFFGTEKLRACVERLDPLRLGRILITNALRNEEKVVYDYEGVAYTSSPPSSSSSSSPLYKDVFTSWRQEYVQNLAKIGKTPSDMSFLVLSGSSGVGKDYILREYIRPEFRNASLFHGVVSISTPIKQKAVELKLCDIAEACIDRSLESRSHLQTVATKERDADPLHWLQKLNLAILDQLIRGETCLVIPDVRVPLDVEYVYKVLQSFIGPCSNVFHVHVKAPLRAAQHWSSKASFSPDTSLEILLTHPTEQTTADEKCDLCIDNDDAMPNDLVLHAKRISGACVAFRELSKTMQSKE